MTKRYASLNDDLRKQLSAIQTGDGLIFPCLVTFEDATEQDKVFLAHSEEWIKHWGVWPEDDKSKQSVDVRAIASIRESPTRLPAKFAAEIYKAGESGMGYCLFKVMFTDGSEQAYSSGNAVDFIDYPVGQSPSTVIGVVPHAGRTDTTRRHAPDYAWCLFK